MSCNPCPYYGDYCSNNQCYTCPGGYYCPTPYKPYNYEIYACNGGYYCPQQTTTEYACPAGYYCPPYSSSPTPCPAGYYCQAYSSYPTSCPAGYYCYAYSSSPSIDYPGHFSDNYASSETACPGGTYQPNYGQSYCYDCPAGYYCPQTSTTYYGCQAGYYCPSKSSSETPCPAGYYCPAYSSSPSIDYPGHFSDNYASSETACPGGTYQPNYGQSYCYDCPAGYYCPQTSTTYYGCQAGYYCPSKSSSETPCPAGYYCPAYSSSANEDTPGYYSGNYASSETACPGGTYQPNYGQSYCYDCPAGYYCGTGTSSPSVCQAGYYSLSGSTYETACSAGTYSNSTGASSCTSCGMNTYSGSSASTYCKNCPAGKTAFIGYSQCFLPPTGQPTGQPTLRPTMQPTGQPTGHPTGQPTRQPTGYPTGQPTREPTGQPTGQPTRKPSGQPTRQPTGQPTGQPTRRPTGQPTRQPTGHPTGQPTRRPTCQPTMQPTGQPTRQPTAQPTRRPTGQPTGQPTMQPTGQPTMQPTGQPTCQPTMQPSGQPTRQPTGQPTGQPTRQPTGQPTGQPTRQPTGQPTAQPTMQPSRQPTSQPTMQPSGQPTMQPTGQPTAQPTMQPTGQPTRQPTGQPTRQPTGQPTGQPTRQPTGQPSGQPTRRPTGQPTMQPSMQPTGQPTAAPTGQPTMQPSGQPTRQPTGQPTRQPTGQPTRQPTGQPTRRPTGQPTRQPTMQPTAQPTSQPTIQPSGQPSDKPTMQPSGQPSIQPTSQPTMQPSEQPSAQPTGEPTMQPTGQPSMQPTNQPTMQPSRRPSAQPTGQPSTVPTRVPVSCPSNQPSSQPTAQPISQPTSQPSVRPTGQPTHQPTGQPSGQPTRQPTGQPTSQPTGQPTSQPTRQPTGQPTIRPSAHPSMRPTSHPSIHKKTLSPSRSADTHKPSQSQKPTSIPTIKPPISTHIPTKQSFPTSVPSSRPTVSITPSVPKVKNIAITASSHNVTLKIKLFSSRDSPGRIYCAAMTTEIIPASVKDVMAKGIYVDYLSSLDFTTVVISKLQALTSYNAFCYVQNSNGAGIAYADMFASKLSFTTTCCQRISFVNSPVSVYGNVSAYTVSTSRSTYMFTYSLDSPPSQGSITVTPMITLSNGSATTSIFVSTPSSVVFQNYDSSAKLKGFFYLNTQSSVSGRFLIQLSISGAHYRNYTSDSTIVDILSLDQPLPAPKLLSCLFSNNGGSLIVTFDTATDLGGITAATWSCSLMFTFTGSDVAICSWISLSTLTATFGAIVASTAAAPQEGGYITLTGGSLRAACRSGTVCSKNYILQVADKTLALSLLPHDNVESSVVSVTIQAPAVPLLPTLLLSLPTQCGACNDLKIDLSASTGNGGRPWTSVIWVVLAANGDTKAIASYLTFNYDPIANTVTVPRYLLISTTYSFTVTVTNFLGASASQSSTVVVSGDPNLPTATILGSKSIVMKATGALTLIGSGQLSVCASSSILNYTWSISNSSGYSFALKSASRDPKTYLVAPYSFHAGSSYIATLTVTSLNAHNIILSSGFATADFYIAHGVVIAAIRGGYSRQVSLDQVLLLDASISSDEDTKTPTLFYSWSCSVGSLDNFGSSCNLNMTLATTSSGVFTLPQYAMTVSTIYNFVVIVSTIDQRRDSKIVTITALLPGAPVIVSANTQVKFNSDRALTIPAIVTADVPVSCYWTASTGNTPVSLTTALTTVSRTFLASEAVSGVSYPLLIPAETFTPGRTYTFRLSSSPLKYPALVTHTDIVLIANSPPHGGYAFASPSTGVALNTTFSFATSGWVSDVTDYPLSFNFAYQLATLKAALIINVLSPLPYTSSPLPPGLPSLKNAVVIIANAIDVFGSAANATTSVTVLLDPHQSPSRFLTQYLSKSLLSGNTDGAFSTMNLVSSAISTNNCSASPNCTVLHRNNCLLTVNTCGSCLFGYKGIVGDANTPCFSSSSVNGAIGSPCLISANCLYDLCTDGACVAPKKTCPSSSPDTICSGHGRCSYKDVSMNILKTCLITDTSCTASCTCSKGYGGIDCSLDAAAYALRSTTRVSICLALNTIIGVSTKSAHLFDSLVSSLESAYEVTEITSLAGKAECSKVLRFLGTLAAKGFLAGTQASTGPTFTEISSQFVGSTPTPSAIAGYSRRILGTANQFANDVTTAVAGITDGSLKGMVAGQNPVSLVSSNVKATMTYELVSNLTHASLSPPSTDADVAYGSLQPRIVVPNNGIAQCSTSNYAQLSTLQFGSNPHTGSSALQSPLLQFSSTITTKSLKSSKSSIHSADAFTALKSTIPAYYIILQFVTKQKYNLSIQAGPYDHHRNVTLPECSLYDAGLAKYVSCKDCNISSYTNFNATFGCYNIKNLCPSTSTSRRLDTIDYTEESEGEYRGYGHVYPLEDDYGYERADDVEKDAESEEEEEWYGSHRMTEKRDQNKDQLSYFRRVMSYAMDMNISMNGSISDSGSPTNSTSNTTSSTVATTDDYMPSDDDGPAAADDMYSSKSQASASEFGSILAAIGAELASVLSLNPFAIDLSKATAILALVSSICGSIIFGLCFFLRWDKTERHEFIYLLEEKLQVSKDLINEDLIRGGSGISIGKSPARNKKIRDGEFDLNFMNLINSSFYKIGKNDDSTLSGSQDSSEGMRKDIVRPLRGSNIAIHPASLPPLLVAQFTNYILPGNFTMTESDQLEVSNGTSGVSTGTGLSIISNMIYTLQRTHYISQMFFGSSVRVSRTLRYLDMCKTILLGIFIDTIIYGVFFPSDSTCPALTTKLTCLSIPSKIIAGATQCKWDKATGCDTLPPPSSITLTLLLAFIIMLFVIPLDCGIDYILEEFASKRPILEKWGMSTDSWLGSVYHKVGDNNSPLEVALNLSKEMKLEKDRKDRKISSSLSRISSSLSFPNNNPLAMTSEITESDNDFIAKKLLTDLCSPEEELHKLMKAVQESIDDTYSYLAGSNDRRADASGLSTTKLATMKAVETQLMINFDGSLKPLTCRQRLFYTDRESLLGKRISLVRGKAKAICDEINEMEVGDESLKDIALMRMFILEQVSFLYRFSLRKNFERIDGMPPSAINPLPWVISWVIFSGSLMFFIYWIFAWGVTNGGSTLNEWGTDYSVAVIQDIFVCETAKLCIMFVFAVISAKPQLQVIKRVINDCALSLVQDGDDSNGEINLVQSLSPSCRAAHMSALNDLPSSAVLRKITDSDVERCRENKLFSLGSIIFYLILMAASLAAINEGLIDQFMDLTLSSVWLGFLLVNTKICAVSPAILIVVYAVLGGIIAYRFYIIIPSVRMARQVRSARAYAANELHRGRKFDKNMGRSVFRCLHILNGRLMVYIGNVAMNRCEIRRQSERVVTLNWCRMNTSSHMQGRSNALSLSSYKIPPSSTDSSRKNSIKSGTSRDSPQSSLLHRSDCLIVPRHLSNKRSSKTIVGNGLPYAILSMRITGKSVGGSNKELNAAVNSSDIDTISSTAQHLTIPVITRTGTRHSGAPANSYQATREIITDPHLILSRMFSRHLVGVEAFEKGEHQLCSLDQKNGNESFVLLFELFDLLKYCWERFHPGSMILTNEEKIEIESQLTRWMIERLRSNIFINEDGILGEEGMTFNIFSIWFLETISRLESTDDPTRITRIPKTERNALSSESISIFSAEKDERSEEKRDIDDCSNFESNHVALVAISGTDRVYDDRSCNFM